MAPPAINQPFSPFGPAARAKVLILGQPDSRRDRFCSLPIERVSFDESGRKISEPCLPSPSGLRRADPVSAVRRWFWGRKPDAGFLLAGFPATLLQAKIFDEWLDARQEGLDAVVAGEGSPPSVVSHYRALGLIDG